MPKSRKRQKFVRVEAAYRYTVTLRIRRPIIAASTSDCSNGRSGSRSTAASSAQVRVKGMVSGVVWLDDNQTRDRDARLEAVGGLHQDVQARHGAAAISKCSLLEKETKPNYLKVSLEKDPNPPAGDRGYYKLTVRVPSTKENTSRPAGDLGRRNRPRGEGADGPAHPDSDQGADHS